MFDIKHFTIGDQFVAIPTKGDQLELAIKLVFWKDKFVYAHWGNL